MKIRIVMSVICCLMSAALNDIVLAQPDVDVPTGELSSVQRLDASEPDLLSSAIVGSWDVIKYDSENRIMTGKAIFSADGTLVDTLSIFGNASEWKVRSGRALLLKTASDSGEGVETYSIAMFADARINLAKGHDTYFLHKTAEISGANGSAFRSVKKIAGSSLSAVGQVLAR